MKIGLLGALFLLFTGLKLSGIIAWSWWWVTAPLWIPFAIGGGGIILFGALTGLLILIATGGKK